MLNASLFTELSAVVKLDEGLIIDEKGSKEAVVNGYKRAYDSILSKLECLGMEHYTGASSSTHIAHAFRVMRDVVSMRLTELQSNDNESYKSTVDRSQSRPTSVDRKSFQVVENTLNEDNQLGWDDIVGLEDAKRSLFEAILYPVLMPQLFQSKILANPGAILLYGSPGTGKTLLVRCIASQFSALCGKKCTVLAISPSNILSKWTGESEQRIRECFAQAITRAPSIIFIDELDAICGSRGQDTTEAAWRLLTELLIQMSALKHRKEQVTIVGATNLPHVLDNAILRRFTKRIEVPLPTLENRQTLIRLYLTDVDHILTAKEVLTIAHKTENWSGADLEHLVRDAVMGPIHELYAFVRRKLETSVEALSSPSSSLPSNDENLRTQTPWHPRSVTAQDFYSALEHMKSATEFHSAHASVPQRDVNM